MNGFLGSLLTMFYFTSYSPRYLKFSNSYFSRVFICKIVNYVSPCILFHRYILDVVIILERVTYFGRSGRIKTILNYKPSYLMIGLLIISFTIQLPILFQLQARNDVDFNNLMSNLKSYKSLEFCEKIEFFETLIGKIILLLIIVLRDIATLLIEMHFSYKSLKYYRLYLNKRSVIIARRMSKNSINTQNSSQNCFSMTIRKKDSNLTKMTLVLSLGSIICHSLSLVCTILLMINRHQTYVFFICLFIILLKNSLNIFFFYFFNKNFKKSLNKYIFNRGNSE